MWSGGTQGHRAMFIALVVPICHVTRSIKTPCQRYEVISAFQVPSMIQLCLLFNFLSLFALVYSNSYNIVREYSGLTFFDRWDFYGFWDNLTLGENACKSLLKYPLTILFIGDVWYLDRNTAIQQGLVYINGQNQAIIKVDNGSQVAFGDKRNSVFVTVVISPNQILS
jgi:hypothetical protein